MLDDWSRGRDRSRRRVGVPLREAVALAVALLALDYTLVATGFELLVFLVGHLLVYVAVVGILARQRRQQRDGSRWTTALAVVLVPVGIATTAATVYADSLAGPVLVALLGGVVWLRVAEATDRPRGPAALAVAALGLAVVLGAFSPLAVGGRLVPAPGSPLSVELIPASDEHVFGIRTPILVMGRWSYHVTVELLPALVGLAAYAAGRRATLPGEARSGETDPSATTDAA